MQGGTFKGNVSSRAHEGHTDFLTDVFSGFFKSAGPQHFIPENADSFSFSWPRNEENPMWVRRNSREKLFKSSWRQFGLLSCLDDKTMQECVSCMKVRRTVLMHIFVLRWTDIQRASQVRSFAKGATIIRKGSVGTTLYFLDMATARVANE